VLLLVLLLRCFQELKAVRTGFKRANIRELNYSPSSRKGEEVGEDGGKYGGQIVRELVLSASRRLHTESMRRNEMRALSFGSGKIRKGRVDEAPPKYSDSDVGIVEFVSICKLPSSVGLHANASGGKGGIGGILKAAWQDFWVSELDEKSVPVWLDDVSQPLCVAGHSQGVQGSQNQNQSVIDGRFLKFIMAKTGWDTMVRTPPICLTISWDFYLHSNHT
jgi:hypothetical protein